MTVPAVGVPAPRAAVPLSRAPLRTRSKQVLLQLSHAMEDAFAVPGAGGRLALGLFQHRRYFDVEAQRWAALAAGGATVVVAFTGPADDLPPGVHGVSLPDDHPLAREWLLVLLDGSLGAVLTASDTRRLDLSEHSLEAARTFTATWSFVRDDAVGHAARVLDRLGPGLPPDVAQATAARLAPAALPPGALEQRFTAALSTLVEALDRGLARRRALDSALDEVRRQAEQDRLTGLHNRRYLDRFLASAAGGSALPACALLVDVDRLKAANDDHGHAAGDALLAAVASALREVVRDTDVVVRWGGDEFLVLLPGTDPDAGLGVAQRIVAEVAAARLPAPWGDLEPSVSVGVCPADPAQLPLERLDAALYAVKRAGRGAARLA